MNTPDETKLRIVVARVLQADVTDIDMNSSPASIASWDSLNHMQLVFALEEEYAVTFTEEQIADMTTYSAIVSVVDEATR